MTHPPKVSLNKLLFSILFRILSIFFPLAEKYPPPIVFRESEKDLNNTSYGWLKKFLFKNKIKGKIGTFSFKDKKVVQELEIYKTENNKFIKY